MKPSSCIPALVMRQIAGAFKIHPTKTPIRHPMDTTRNISVNAIASLVCHRLAHRL